MQGSDIVGVIILVFLLAWLIMRALKRKDKDDEHSKSENWR